MKMWGSYIGIMQLYFFEAVILLVFEKPVLGRTLLGQAISYGFKNNGKTYFGEIIPLHQ